MSRIGKKPIPLPKGVSYAVEGNTVTVQGPKGKVTTHIPGGVTLETKDGVLTRARISPVIGWIVPAPASHTCGWPPPARTAVRDCF